MYNRHHVPPKHPDKRPAARKMIEDKDRKDFKKLFQDCTSYNECVGILLTKWWTPRASVSKGCLKETKTCDSNKQFILIVKMEDHRAYHNLFRNPASFQGCCAILLNDWWSPALNFPVIRDRNRCNMSRLVPECSELCFECSVPQSF